MELVYTEDQLGDIVLKILAVSESKIICLNGPMGSGKTTLIKEMVRALGGAQQGSSPTFSIVNEYSGKDGSLLGFHFDFYRLEDEKEALDIGLEDYLSQDVWIFMEWPENIASLIPPEATRLTIEVLNPLTRKIILES
ncbi:MAG: tRNA (adenosine(37)-N6)-threonylcarbamoyltransferase complex ATPase subunit type 1 TsaE [Flavobacteriaceae bacterium]